MAAPVLPRIIWVIHLQKKEIITYPEIKLNTEVMEEVEWVGQCKERKVTSSCFQRTDCMNFGRLLSHPTLLF